MKQLKEKSFTVNVELNEKYPDVVQTMLEHLYNDGNLNYDEIHLNGNEVVSECIYKGLSYGSIGSEAFANKEAIEKEGYHLECIFTIAEKQQDPFIDCFGTRPGDYCILADVHYALRLKFSFTRLEDVTDTEDVTVCTAPDSKEKAERFILGNANGKKHKHKIMFPTIAAPF